MTGLIEISLTDRQFTWSNMREDPYLAKLDRYWSLKIGKHVLVYPEYIHAPDLHRITHRFVWFQERRICNKLGCFSLRSDGWK